MLVEYRKFFVKWYTMLELMVLMISLSVRIFQKKILQVQTNTLAYHNHGKISHKYNGEILKDASKNFSYELKAGVILIILSLFFTQSCSAQINNPPYIPSNPSPSNGAQNQPISLTLSWSGGDPDGDIVTYGIFMDTNPNPTTMIWYGTSTSSSVMDLGYGTTYYWYVGVNDGYTVTYSPVWSFTTQAQQPINNPPYIPSNPSPSNGAQNQPISLALSWSGGDPDGDIVTYGIFMDTNPNPTTMIWYGTSTSSSVTSLGYGTTYYWYVGVEDDYSVTYSPVWSFTTQAQQITTGSISITSSPSGAEVLVDGLPKGTASPTITVSGLTPSSHNVKCRLSGYSDYDTTVTVTAGSVSPVTCTLSPMPMLSVSPDPISFNFSTMSTGELGSRTFSISNAGGGALTWSASDDQPWITLNPTSGTDSGTITIKINTASLSPGNYRGSITITSNGGTKQGSVYTT